MTHKARFSTLLFVFAHLFALTLQRPANGADAPQAAPPNIVMIIADDQAWTDYGFMGHPDIKTPNLDRLAARSAVFKRGYVPTSLCRPSLATLISGLYPHQHKISGNDPAPGVDRAEMLKHIRRLPTLPKLLASKGYASFQSGKWWEGQYTLGGFSAGMTHGDPKRGGRHGDDGLKIGREGMQPVLDFIDATAGKPFFVWYAPMMPHMPHTPPARLLQKYVANGRPIEISRYYAMCEWFDETCGLLFDHLERKGLSQNTLVVFSADNGWIQRTPQTALPDGWRYPFAPRSKNSPYEGGIRTPILISWPERIKPGTYDSLASTIDFAPTILNAVGVGRDPAMQGIDLRDVADHGGRSDRKSLFGAIFSHNVPDIDNPAAGLQFRWCIDGPWKLITPRNSKAAIELFDIAGDPHETKNAAQEHAEVVARLRKLTDRWWDGESVATTTLDRNDATEVFPTGLPDDAAKYEVERERLRAADVEMRFDASLALNADEVLVAEHLKQIRNTLRKKYLSAKRFPPAEPFHLVKQEIQTTELFAFLKKMPKGGALHIHTSSTAPVSALINLALQEPGCYVCWPENSDQNIKGQMGFYQPGKAPAGYLPIRDVADKNKNLAAELSALLTIGPDDATLNNFEIWQKFNQIFQRLGGLLAYQPLFMKYYDAAFRTLLADNVSYIELRAGFGDLYDLNGKTWSFRDRASFWWDIRNDLRKDYPNFDLKLIYSGYRADSRGDVWSQIEQAVELRKQWSDRNFVVGFDLVGEEDAGHKTKYFLTDWVKLKSYLASQKTTLPFYFHDGESDWSNDKNLYDAFLLGSRRIGHGFNLFRFPTLQEEFKRNRIAVEVCPISNQQLRYVPDLRMHPAAGFLNEGIPCVLSSDDPSIFGNDGLSFDFWEATMAWNLDLRALKQLARNSLQYSAMNDAEKTSAITAWQQTWNAWIASTLEKK